MEEAVDVLSNLAKLNATAASFHRKLVRGAGGFTVCRDKVVMLEAHPGYKDRSDAELIQMAKAIPGMQRRGQTILPITTRAMAIALLMGERELL